MSDITVQILEGIRADIAALDAKVEALDVKIDGVEGRLDRKIDALDHRLSHRLDQTNDRLGSMVDLLGHFAKREDDIDSRLRALEDHVFGRSQP